MDSAATNRWPSNAGFGLVRDSSHGKSRTQIRCARFDSHRGRVFSVGPKPGGQRQASIPSRTI